MEPKRKRDIVELKRTMKKLTSSDLIEIFGSLAPPALLILLLDIFVYSHPAHPVSDIFLFFGTLTVTWHICGETMEASSGDKVDRWMRRLHPLLNLLFILFYFSLIFFFTVLCLLNFNGTVLIIIASVGNYFILLLPWGLISIPYLKGNTAGEPDEPDRRHAKRDTVRETDFPPPRPGYPEAAITVNPQTRILCRKCGIAVTSWLREPDIPINISLRDTKTTDGEALLPRGLLVDVELFLEKDECFYGAENSQVIINFNDMTNIRPSGVRNGCCGVDGSDGINIFCIRAHPIGTEISDCYQLTFAHMPTEYIVIENKSAVDRGVGSSMGNEQEHPTGKKPYRLPEGLSFVADGPFWVVARDLRRIAEFIRDIYTDDPIRLKVYEDWWQHDGLHFFSKTIGMEDFLGMFGSPKMLLAALPGEDRVHLGISDAENTWYLRLGVDTECDDSTIPATYSFTCIDSIGLRFRQKILPYTGAATRIMSSLDHYCGLTR